MRQQRKSDKNESEFWPSPLSSKSFTIQVSHRLNHVPPLSINLGFSFPVLSPGCKVFSLTISTLYDLLVFLPDSLISGRFFINWYFVRFFSSVSRHRVMRFFTSNIILLRLISFPTELECYHLSPGFLPHSTLLVGRFFTRFLFLNRWLPRSTEFTSKREVIIMSWSRDPPITWSQHVTTHMIWSYDPDTWPMNFILTSRHYRFQYPRYHSPVMTTSWSHSSKYVSSAYRGPWAGARRSYFQINAYSGSSGCSVRGVTSIGINWSYWWEPRWVVSSTNSWMQLARPSRTSISASTIYHTTR